MQLLKSNGFGLRYLNRKKLGEVDFILQCGKSVIPIEVKSGQDYRRHAALDHLLAVSEWPIRQAYVFCKGNISVQGPITDLPWYMIHFLQQERLPEKLIVNLDLSALHSDSSGQ